MCCVVGLIRVFRAFKLSFIMACRLFVCAVMNVALFYHPHAKHALVEEHPITSSFLLLFIRSYYSERIVGF